jgi:hypothetical protein
MFFIESSFAKLNSHSLQSKTSTACLPISYISLRESDELWLAILTLSLTNNFVKYTFFCLYINTVISVIQFVANFKMPPHGVSRWQERFHCATYQRYTYREMKDNVHVEMSLF